MPLLPKKTKAAKLFSLVSISLIVFSIVFVNRIKTVHASDFSDGADGSVTISTNKNINTDVIASGRTIADGEAFTVSAIGSNTITVTGSGTDGTSASSLSDSVANSDVVLLINLQGSSGATTHVGNYEYCYVASVSSAVITCDSSIVNIYGESSNSSLSGQKIIVQRVPNYSDVTIDLGASLTANAWDGSLGGVVIFWAGGTVSIDGSVSTLGKGYRGGTYGGVGQPGMYGFQGEGRPGTGIADWNPNDGGGGAGTAEGEVFNGTGGGGGAGAGYGSAGSDGVAIGAVPGNATAGTTYGATSLGKIFLGSGGGGGGAVNYGSGVGSYGGAGGNGGGIVLIIGASIQVTGTLNADGTAGANGISNGSYGGGGGGGGAGGSVYLQASDQTLGSSLVSAAGGTFGAGTVSGEIGTAGGAGGDGRIRLDYFSISGTTSPAAGFTGGFGSVITDLDASLNAVEQSDWSISVSNHAQTGTLTVGIKNTGGYRIASFDVDFSGNHDWSAMTADSNGSDKSFFHYPGGFSSIPGSSGTGYTLYVPKNGGSSVGICPGATSLTEVTKSCSGFYTLTEADSDVTVAVEGGVQYWKIANLTGTGGISLSGLSDLLTRLQVSTASDHTIQFTSVNGATASGNTVAVQFDPAGQNFDLTSITFADIDLEINNVGETLAASAGVSTWGVNINTSLDTITFTAPTSGSGYFPAGGVAVVKIGKNATGGTNQIVNPAAVNSYEVHMIVVDGAGTETGEVEIPIIDDDTVNITGYIDSFISFDIDTAATNVQCDAAGGTNPCDSYGGSSDNSGYLVDLGEMTTSAVNNSGDSVAHADGGTGAINSIYFDLSTNASGGAAVTVTSLNAALLGPGANSIPTVGGSGEQHITAGSGLYGINSHAGLVDTSVSGTAVINTDCDGTAGVDYYCDTPASPAPIFTTNNAPIDTLRLQWEVAASPSSLNGTGTYTDQLTFIATATF
jgi:hypothetical protein